MEFLILEGSVIQRIREEVGRLTSIQADICLANLGGKAGALEQLILLQKNRRAGHTGKK